MQDYGSLQRCAEDASALVVDQILTDGGTVLWQKYLERKAFPFAADAAVDAAVSRLQMCFVMHDDGEKPDATDDWALEEEPEPGEVDSWARMHLSVRKLKAEPGKKMRGGMTPGATAEAAKSTVTSTQGSPGPTSATPEGKQSGEKGPATKKKKGPESRVQPLVEENFLDEEEERLRDAKQSEEQKRREKEKQARDAERRKEQERQRIAALHEEMAKRPHTFDHEGALIWIDEVKTDKLPSVQEKFPYTIKKARGAEQRQQSDMAEFIEKGSPGKDATGKKGERNRRNRQRGGVGAAGNEPEFTDGFSKLQHGQPPILETMTVSPGVLLESMGRKKAGPEARNERQMTRKEYVQQAERDTSLGAYSDEGSPAAKAEKEEEKPAAPAAAASAGGDAAAAAAAAAGGDAAGTTLPPLARNNSIVGQKGPAVDFGGDQPPAPPRAIQKAPKAPAYATRARKFEAIGPFQRSRYHKPSLGGPSGFGMAQPPLGATMGHGLLRHGSMKESYFFPPAVPPLNPALLRGSASEGALGSLSGRKGPSPGRGSSRDASLSRLDSMMAGQSSEEAVDPYLKHGTMVAERTNAYRVFKMAVSPDKRI